MEGFGDTHRERKGLTFAWRRWQLGLTVLGAIACIAMSEGALESRTSAQAGPLAQIGQDDYEDPVWSLAFAGRHRLASSTITGEVHVKDLTTGRVVRIQNGPGKSPQALAFSPSGRILAVAGDGVAVRLWDADTGTELEPLRVDKGTVRCVAFSPDGTRLATSTCAGDGQPPVVTIWDYLGRRRLLAREGRGATINALALTRDGSRLVAAGSSGEFQIWDVTTGEERVCRQAHRTSITVLAFSPDGGQFATAAYVDGDVRLWDAASGEPRGEPLTFPTGVAALDFSPDGTMLALARGDGIASLWDLASAREVAAVRVPTGALQSVCFSGDGRVFATGGIDGSIRFWDFTKLRDPHP
jgi:WD40 repeat protein